jgi:hypothetical protein
MVFQMNFTDLKKLLLLAAVLLALLRSPDLGAAALVVYLITDKEIT